VGCPVLICRLLRWPNGKHQATALLSGRIDLLLDGQCFAELLEHLRKQFCRVVLCELLDENPFVVAVKLTIILSKTKDVIGVCRRYHVCSQNDPERVLVSMNYRVSRQVMLGAG
jgi:hypothetical protein